MLKLKNIIVYAAIITASIEVHAQQTFIYRNPESVFRNATELFNKQKYGSAQEAFEETLQLIGINKSSMSVDAQFYRAICAYELFHENAQFLLSDFIAKNPESSRLNIANFTLGKLEYRKKRYNKVIPAFENLDTRDLSQEENVEYKFKLGYSYFDEGNLDKASINFYDILDVESKYRNSANYYYSHIAFSKKNYETALKGFQKLTDDNMFGAIVPYYIIQIYYLQGKYEKVIELGPSMLDTTKKSVKRAPEIAKLLGESYYHLNKFKEAEPFLLQYKEKSSVPLTRDDNYQLAYCYYKLADFKNAVDYFKIVATRNDTISQNAYYHLGDCFVKLNEKPFARNAFAEAAKMKHIPAICEDALFNYAKLAYELAYNPYNEAIEAFQKYIKEYPKSYRLNEAYTYLVNLYLTTNNYKEALASIEKIDLKDDQMKSAYQKIAFNRAVELFNNTEYDAALPLFVKSAKMPYNKGVQALSHYWQGEALYRKSKYDDASEEYKSFLINPGAVSLGEYPIVNYNIAYCYFNQKDYENALVWFRKYIKDPKKDDNKRLGDANLRTGDCFFILRQYDQAYAFYSKAADIKAYDPDYAIYQKAITAGLINKFTEKTETLKYLQKYYANSNYIAGALFEQAKTYQLIGDDELAIATFRTLISDYPNSIHVKASYSKIGLIQYKSKDYDRALATFKKIVSDYPNTEESKEALVSIRNICIDMNQVEQFFDIVKTQGTDVAKETQDSTTYEAVINRYLDGDCVNAIKGFANYISQFPTGNFILKAQYYKAECEYKQNNVDAALAGYNYVISQNKSEYTEESLLKAAYINVNKSDYAAAAQNYLLLDKYADNPINKDNAKVYRMQCLAKTKQYSEAMESARIVLQMTKIKEEIEEEAHATIARSAFAMDSTSMALAEYQYLAKKCKSEVGAEAKFQIASIQFNKGQHAECEKTIFELINQVPSYDYWIAKGFILLADNYVKLNNTFQAKHTLKSIIDNYDGADLVKEAQTKLDNIIADEKRKELEEEQLKLKQKEELQINNSEKENQKLFVEPTMENVPVKEEEQPKEEVKPETPTQSPDNKPAPETSPETTPATEPATPTNQNNGGQN